MADSSKKTNKKIIRRLRRSEEDSLHLIEFSQGKPILLQILKKKDDGDFSDVLVNQMQMFLQQL